MTRSPTLDKQVSGFLPFADRRCFHQEAPFLLLFQIFLYIINDIHKLREAEEMAEIRKQTIIRFPESLLREIDSTVGERNRSRFIIEASRERLKWFKQKEALAKTAGTWSEAEHSDLLSMDQVEDYLENLRKTAERAIPGPGGYSFVNEEPYGNRGSDE